MKTILNLKSLLRITLGVGAIVLMFIDFQIFLAALFAAIIIGLVWILNKNGPRFYR